MSELAKKLIAENKAKHERGEDASYLDLGNCGLMELPDLSGMEWLETLVISNEWVDWEQKKLIRSQNIGPQNRIAHPPVHFLPDTLKKLVFSGRWNDRWPISDFDFLENLTSLTSLHLGFNQISDGRFLEELPSLTSLYINSNKISDICFLEKLPQLTSLDISSNEISDGRFLGKLLNLTSLDISANQISDGRFLEELRNLTSLYIIFNKISDWRFLEKLPKLISLDISANQISDGRFLKKLPQLTSLYISNNQISDGCFLEKLTNLTSLDLNDNQISDAQFLGKLTSLTKIDLSNNQLSDLTPLIYFIQKKGMEVVLKEWYETQPGEINVKDNPITNPPPEIVQQGNAAILNYFSERSKQQFQSTEIKLILIGNSTAGKTSLSRYLRERVYEHGQATTHGIQNYRWKPEGSNLDVNIWDFGGQEYYHSTHRLFLSRNAVYVLVWDACTDKGGTEPTEIYYPEEGQSRMVSLEHFPHLWWLKNIRHFTSGSNPPVSVLLVQNKSARDGIKRLSPELEKPPFDLLPELIDNHIDIAASAQHQYDPQPDTRKWQRSFEEFEERLSDRLKSQLTHYEFAIYHRDIRDRVRALASGDNPVNEMPWAAFEEMCRNIEPDAKMDLVQIYLRDITGDILYFDQNERLRHRVFLRPDWVCNRIYAILSHKVLERKGLFDLAWVQEALSCEEAEALNFVELMREFQLVFAENDETGAPTGNYVAPQYLPDACTNPGELEGAKKYANLDHAFTLWFPEFLPKSHIARFVAHWGSNAKQRLFWKNGLLFQTDGCTALVERSEESKIRVDIQQGDTAKRATAMQRIFQSFLDLEDGQANFAISFENEDFVSWKEIQEAIQSEAKRVKVLSPTNELKLIPLPHFFTAAQQQRLSLKHKIQKLLQEAKTKEALDLLVTVVPEATALLTTFNEAKKRNTLGTLSFEAFSQEQNKVTLAALDMLTDLQDGH